MKIFLSLLFTIMLLFNFSAAEAPSPDAETLVRFIPDLYFTSIYALEDDPWVLINEFSEEDSTMFVVDEALEVQLDEELDEVTMFCTRYYNAEDSIFVIWHNDSNTIIISPDVIDGCLLLDMHEI